MSGWTSSWSPTSRGRGSTTTSAACARRVVINTDLPVLSTSLGHLVAHEAYPGPSHRAQPQGGGPGPPAPVARGDDLPGRHAPVPAGRGPGRPRARGGRRPAARAHGGRPISGPSGSPTTPTWSPRCRPPVTRRSDAVRANAALLLHDEGVDADSRSSTTWPGGGSCPGPGPHKAVSFLADPTWRAYIFCYVEGVAPLPAVRRRRPGPLRPAAHRAAASPTWTCRRRLRRA